MQLTKLEIKGFKSFGDKIIINFDEGVTSIVGPNGCGKSNVVDAIRWVLGEQSTRVLRSEKMENIIFNGTKTRKPANLAEVTLTFNNTKNILPTEFSQVSITRRLYRSGESEYRLNDVQCRLKDITDLFLDTGVGSDSYSIIELKMIEEIIANKENSRRALFEEASGISKYKLRKKQTFTKLRDTENDLTRVNDLLFEIEKNLKSLENQAKKAEKYHQLKNEYKRLSIDLASIRLGTFSETLAKLDAQESTLESAKAEVLAKLASHDALLQQKKLDNTHQEKNLSVQQKNTNELVAKIRSYENEKNIKNEQLKFLQETENRLQTELHKDEQQINHVLYNIKRINEETLEETQKLDALESLLKELDTELSSLRQQQEASKNELDEINKTVQGTQNQLYQAEKDLDILTIQKDALIQETTRNTEDAESKKAELDDFDLAINNLTQEVENQKTLQQELDLHEEHLKISIEETENFLNEAKDQLSKEGRVLDAKQNEYNLTKSLVDNLEGFPESIRFLKKNADWAEKALLLSDILFCKEEYRIAIENYLEPFMNHYVVNEFSEAIAGINLLSESAQGRANFFVCEAFDSEVRRTTKDNIPSHYISALEVVDVDPKYLLLCEHLLHNVYISNEDSDLNVQLFSEEIVVLNKNGKFIKTIRSMSGGSVGLFEGKRIGRAKNLEILSKEIAELTISIEKIKLSIEDNQQKLSSLRASSKQQELTECSKQLQLLENELISLRTRSEQYHAFLENSKNRKQDIENKIHTIETDLANIAPTIAKLKEEKAIWADTFNQKQQLYNEIAEMVLQKSSHYNEQNLKFHQQKNKINSLNKDLEYRESQEKTLRLAIEKNQSELKKIKEDIGNTIHHVDFNDEGLVSLYEEKDAMEKALGEMEQLYNDIKNEIIQLENLTASLRKEKDESEQKANEIRDSKNNLKIELNSLKERLSVEFNFDISELIDNEDKPSIDEPEDKIRDRITKTKQQLDDFGSVNPMAMEAYNEMNERYTFINEQKADLLNAKESLLSTIQEIDDTAKDQFMAAFSSVRDNFIKVFRTLFNEEDSCDLILLSPETPLDSDIDIIARPKGKRPLSINQLSGGEKTLTATALLFSLYLLKPAPFCIFDEVDAPLDDTNIDKFNNIIREFSKDSQFIIVSHNKRTIASTDIIYGVTMVETGVSRVVSVDLRNIDISA